MLIILTFFLFKIIIMVLRYLRYVKPMGCRIDGEEVDVKTLSNPERSPVQLPHGWSHACQLKKNICHNVLRLTNFYHPNLLITPNKNYHHFRFNSTFLSFSKWKRNIINNHMNKQHLVTFICIASYFWIENEEILINNVWSSQFEHFIINIKECENNLTNYFLLKLCLHI